MTAIRTNANAERRRAGFLGVHSIDHVHLSVPVMGAAQRFYGAFGLDLRAPENQLHLYTYGSPQRWAVLTEGPRKALQHISFGAFEDDLPKFRARLECLNVPLAEPPLGFESNGLWLRDPDGLLIEIRAAKKNSPDVKPPLTDTPSVPGIANAPSRSEAPHVKPKRLAHILTFTRDVPRTLAFYGDVLGLRLSDRSGDMIGFMHGVHGSDHHMIAFLKSDAPGLHHLSWDTGSIGAIGLGALQMAGKGYSHGWGLGRHVLGSNYFHYIQDPWGSWCEYACDIDYIPAGTEWKAGDHPAEDSFYVWGPEPPADFAVNGEREP
jgi:catechol 2,3-dioxygenase-like lactoylglutathione lyase family enzyme